MAARERAERPRRRVAAGGKKEGLWSLVSPSRAVGQEAASMLGNEVTGQSVNTRGSPLPWPGGGYRIAVKMETSIKLICQPFGHRVAPLDEPDCSQRERKIWRRRRRRRWGKKKYQHLTWRRTNNEKNSRTAQRRRSAELPKRVNTVGGEGGKEGKTHSSPLGVVVEV